MKKNRTTRLAILLLALTMVVLILVSGTYAKYTSSATGTDTIAVAKWDIKLNGTQIATGSPVTATINLFDTIYDSDGSSTETDVDETQTNKLIAPGTSGSFALAVKNDSEVNAKYDVNLSISYANLPSGITSLPLEFSTDGTNWKTTIAEANVSDRAITMNGGDDTTTVYWRWVYENGTGATLTANDATDTALGIAARTARPEVTVTVEVVATQVD